MVNSRNKGRAGEQEVARILRDELGIAVTRNWQQQAAEGGADIVGVPGWSIEVKRAKVWSNGWWTQAAAQAAGQAQHAAAAALDLCSAPAQLPDLRGEAVGDL